MLICQNLICDIYYVLNPERMLLCLQKNGNMLANKRRNNRITKKVCGVFRVIPERIAFEITQFKGVIPAKSTVIAAVDLRMVPLSPTGTALQADFGRFAGIHAVSRCASPCSAHSFPSVKCCRVRKWTRKKTGKRVSPSPRFSRAC